MKVSRIFLQEHLWRKYYLVKNLLLFEIQNLMNINVGLLEWSVLSLIKISPGGTITCARSNNVATLLKVKIVKVTINRRITQTNC